MADSVFRPSADWNSRAASAPAHYHPGPHERVTACDAVLVCPDTGMAAELLPVDSAARILPWSPPADGTSLAAYAEHALALLDDAGTKDCVAVGFSGGTAVAVELARRFPDRIRGVLLLAAPPTAAAETLLHACGTPVALRRLLALGASASLRLTGDLLEAITARLPVTEHAAMLLRQAGLLPPATDPAAGTETLRRLVQHDWRRHAELGLAWSAAARLTPVGLTCPVTVLAGRYDLLADPVGVTRIVAALPQARVRMLATSHFIALEAPDTVRAELALLLRRVDAVERARLRLDPAPPPLPRVHLRPRDAGPVPRRHGHPATWPPYHHESG